MLESSFLRAMHVNIGEYETFYATHVNINCHEQYGLGTENDIEDYINRR